MVSDVLVNTGPAFPSSTLGCLQWPLPGRQVLTHTGHQGNGTALGAAPARALGPALDGDIQAQSPLLLH